MRLFSFGGDGLALAALAHVAFGAYDSYPLKNISTNSFTLPFNPVNLTRLPRLKCISLGSVRSSLPALTPVGSIATPFEIWDILPLDISFLVQSRIMRIKRGGKVSVTKFSCLALLPLARVQCPCNIHAEFSIH